MLENKENQEKIKKKLKDSQKKTKFASLLAKSTKSFSEEFIKAQKTEMKNYKSLSPSKMPEILEKYAILSYLISYDFRKSLLGGGNPFLGSIYEPHLRSNGYFDSAEGFSDYFESLHQKYSKYFHEIQRNETKRLTYYPSRGRDPRALSRNSSFIHF